MESILSKQLKFCENLFKMEWCDEEKKKEGYLLSFVNEKHQCCCANPVVHTQDRTYPSPSYLNNNFEIL